MCIFEVKYRINIAVNVAICYILSNPPMFEKIIICVSPPLQFGTRYVYDVQQYLINIEKL